MGAGSLLALMARHSLLPVRHSSKDKLPACLDAQFGPCQVPPSGLLQLLSSFHIELAERLQHLQLHGTTNAHINWLLDALASTLSTHSSLQTALSATASRSSTAQLAKCRADEVLSMLDVCTALKQVADDIDRQFVCLQHALQSVGHALNSQYSKPSSRGRLSAAARRLSACLIHQEQPTGLCIIRKQHLQPLAQARASLLFATKRELQSAAAPDLVATLLSQAVDGAVLTSLLVLASAVSSLSPPSPRKSCGTIASACKMITKYLDAKGVSAPWAAPLRQLHRDLRREEMSAAGSALFQELQSLHSAATKIHATITTPGVDAVELAAAKQSIESLRKSLREAQACITQFRVQMASSFQTLVALRLALLDSCLTD